MMQSLFSGSLVSYSSQLNVVNEIKKGIPATFSLCIGAAIIWLTFGILVGVFSAIYAGRFSDRLITIFALIGISMPVFWLGLMSRYVFAEGHPFSIFPDGEYVPLTVNPWQWFVHLLMPWWVLAVLFIGFYGRVLRGNILDTINEDYVRTAKAKGLPAEACDGQARSAELLDPDRHALRSRLRGRARRERDLDGDGLQSEGSGAVRRRLACRASTCRRSWA